MRRKEGGFALVLVLVGVALLGLMVESVLLLSRGAVQAESSEVLRAQMGCEAQAGIAVGIAGLLDAHRPAAWRLDGAPYTVVFEGVPVAVRVAAEAGKVDLNGGSLALIAGLFAAAGLDETAAQTMAARVLDWREAGPVKRLNGAKAADYRAAGLDYGPRGGKFQSVSELGLVLGMTPDLYARVAPAVTVYSVFPTPELQSAPALALRASGLDAARVEGIMAARARGEVAPGLGVPPAGFGAQLAGLPGTIFTVTATVREGGMVVSRGEVVRFTGDAGDPVWVVFITGS
jgi:general secretion pathway protein K